MVLKTETYGFENRNLWFWKQEPMVLKSETSGYPKLKPNENENENGNENENIYVTVKK